MGRVPFNLKLWLIASQLFISANVFAGVAKDISFINIVHQEKSKIIVREVPISSFGTKAKLKIVQPDPLINPKHETSEWSGVLVRDLLNKAERAAGKGSSVSLTATDSYSAQVPFADIQSLDIMAATHKDGARVEWSKGGVLAIYPLNHAKLPKEYKETADYWVWSIAALIVGPLDPILEVTTKAGGPRSLILGKDVVGATAPAEPRRAPSATMKSDQARQKDFASIPLGELIKKAGVTLPHGPIVFKTYVQGTLDIAPDKINDYVVLYQMSGSNIPLGYGGPITVCPTNKNEKCTFFVRSLAVD